MDSFSMEQRRSTRYSVQVSAILTFRAYGEHFENMTHDLSVDGASFSAWHPVHMGDGVLISLQFDEERFECKGQVRWVQTLPDGERRFGVRFVDLFDDERRRLQHILRTEGEPIHV